MMLDDALANIVALGQVTDAYTTGTPANLALASAVSTLAASLADGQTGASAALTGNALVGPVAVLNAVDVAGYLATTTPSLAWLTNLQTVLSRP